jgi:hypothetical protein
VGESADTFAKYASQVRGQFFMSLMDWRNAHVLVLCARGASLGGFTPSDCCACYDLLV